MNAEGGSPNLINGVSRQPTEVRLTSQLESSINLFPTVSRGLVRRNPAILKGIIPTKLPENATTHLIDRDLVEQYNVTVSPNGIEVTDLNGIAKPVNAPSGYGYLAGAAAGDLEALTVADHTFILNKKRMVEHSPVLSPAYAKTGLVHVVQGDYHTEYSILIDGDVKAKYNTDGGPYATEDEARRAERGARTPVIASMLAHGQPPFGTTTLPPSAGTFLSNALGSGWEVTLMDNVIAVSNTAGVDFNLEARAGSETRLRAHKGVTKDFSELPRKAPNGFALTIAGSDDTNYDDYYVRFEQAYGAAQGSWRETVGPAIPYRLDPSTMPHVLVREANGSFTFRPAEWADREVGDLDTNPWPSFVSNRIEGMIFFKNRVGFYSGETVSLSRHEDFFNFFVESILTPLDTDPIDVAISYPEVSDIRFAVPFSGETILFTSSVPFRLASSGDLFTPTSVSIEPVLSNRTSAWVRPVVAGDKMYFINDVPSGCFVHEFTYDQDVGVKAAPTITDHVAGYVPSGVTMLEADEDLKVLALVSRAEPNSIYTYKWLWIGQEKAQAAWQKWTLDAPVVGIKFYGEELILVLDRSNSREIVSINCHEAWLDEAPTPIYLDRRVTCTGAYNAETDVTAFELPYAAEGAIGICKSAESFGLRPDVVNTVGPVITLRGRVTGEVFFGFDFESSGVFSQFHVRTQNNQGAYGNAVAGVDVRVGTVIVETGQTAFLDVELNRDYRKPYTYKWAAAQLGTKTARAGELVLGKIQKSLSVLARAGDFTLKFKNRGPYPFTILSYRWAGSAYQI